MDVTCSIDASDPAAFARTVDRCRGVGLRVTATLDAIGVVTGSIDGARLADLARVAGVTAVEPDRTVQLPDPADEVQ